MGAGSTSRGKKKGIWEEPTQRAYKNACFSPLAYTGIPPVDRSNPTRLISQRHGGKRCVGRMDQVPKVLISLSRSKDHQPHVPSPQKQAGRLSSPTIPYVRTSPSVPLQPRIHPIRNLEIIPLHK